MSDNTFDELIKKIMELFKRDPSIRLDTMPNGYLIEPQCIQDIVAMVNEAERKSRISDLDTRRYANAIRDAYTLTEAESLLQEAIDQKVNEAERRGRVDELDKAIRQSEITYTIDVLTESDRVTPIDSEHQSLIEELIIAEGKLIKRIESLQSTQERGSDD